MARTPEQIIQDQVRPWDHLRAWEARRERPRRHWPIVTLSRQFGAPITALADALARRTGFAVWDRELVQAIVEETGGDERILSALDEHRRAAIEDMVHAALQHGRHTNLAYLRSLMRVVHGIADQGAAVVVGRGASFICKPGTALHVRVVCPLEERVRHYAAQAGCDEQQARCVVEQEDAGRAEFVRYAFHRDVADPAHYDLTLNAGVYAPEALADLVLHAYAARFGACPPEPAPAARPARTGHPSSPAASR